MRRWLALLALATSAQADDPFAGIPNVTLDRYDVTGADLPALRRALEAERQVDPADGVRVAAYSRWRFDWYVPGDGKGGCRLDAVELKFSATVRLPRLAADAPAAVRPAWDRFIAAVALHEAGHIRYAWDRRDTVLAALKGATCATATAAGRGAIAAIGSHDRAYDRETRHGASQGAEL